MQPLYDHLHSPVELLGGCERLSFPDCGCQQKKLRGKEIDRLLRGRGRGSFSHVILVTKSKTMHILSLNLPDIKRKNRLLHQYQMRGRANISDTANFHAENICSLLPLVFYIFCEI
jgi:hypothetical protein